MATNLTVGDVLEIKLYWYFTDQIGINVRHFVVDAIAIGPVTDQAFIDRTSTIRAAAAKSIIAAASSYKGMSCSIIAPTIAAQVLSTAGAGVGSATGETMPTQACGIATLRTGLPGRANRGRCYLPFPTESFNGADGLPTGGYEAACIDLLDFYSEVSVTDVAGGKDVTLQPVLYHRASGDTTDIESYVFRRRWATQKRRGSYGKTNDPFPT